MGGATQKSSSSSSLSSLRGHAWLSAKRICEMALRSDEGRDHGDDDDDGDGRQ